MCCVRNLSLVLGGFIGREIEIEKVWAVVENRLLDVQIGVSKLEISERDRKSVV